MCFPTNVFSLFSLCVKLLLSNTHISACTSHRCKWILLTYLLS